MTLNDILRDIHAMREDLLIFERKYGLPTEFFFTLYERGEEPVDSAWVLDWSEWAATYKILRQCLAEYQEQAERLLKQSVIANFSELIERTARHEPIALAA